MQTLGGARKQGGNENEKGDTTRYLLLAGYPVTEREKKGEKEGLYNDYNRRMWWYEG